MAKQLTIELPDDLYEPLRREAEQSGRSAEDIVLERLRQVSEKTPPVPKPTAQEPEHTFARLKRHVVCAPNGVGSDNEGIDRDLAREYESTHEED